MKLKLKRHKQFVKDLKKMRLTDEQFQKFIKYLNHLLNDEPLPAEAKDHSLFGEWQGFRVFHLGGDLLVIYRKTKKEIILTRIGTHSQLFR